MKFDLIEARKKAEEWNDFWMNNEERMNSPGKLWMNERLWMKWMKARSINKLERKNGGSKLAIN